MSNATAHAAIEMTKSEENYGHVRIEIRTAKAFAFADLVYYVAIAFSSFLVCSHMYKYLPIINASR